MNTFSEKFQQDDKERLENIFKSEGACLQNAQYMHFQARGEGFVASFYQSGKLLIQGKKTAELVEKYFSNSQQKAVQNSLNLDIAQPAIPLPHIGIDESGKGDFFGALCIAGVCVDEKSAEILLNLGVCDSKKINDKKILELEEKIKELCKYNIIAIGPKKYNELYTSFKNLNSLLGWGHASVLENLLKEVDVKIAISDQFAKEDVIKRALKERGREIKLIQMHRAEADIAVAAASILARAEFVKRISKLSAQYEINLPKGCGVNVLEQAKKFAQKYGKEELAHVAKLHFKTYNEV